jgi:hypothetical protein
MACVIPVMALTRRNKTKRPQAKIHEAVLLLAVCGWFG